MDGLLVACGTTFEDLEMVMRKCMDNGDVFGTNGYCTTAM
jgi:hypothetical protein